jgi:hypothetical protein
VVQLQELRPIAGAGLAIARAGMNLAGRLVETTGSGSGSGSGSGGSGSGGVAGALAGRADGASGRGLLAELLDRALVQSTDDAARFLREAMVALLVPDEARIIAGLAGRGWSPVVHIESRRDGELHLGLQNASLIGRQAGVALVGQTPRYVGRLLGLGLVALTAAREDRSEEYEVLLAEPDVLDAVRRAGHGPLGARVRRHGVVLSELGAQVWATHQAETPG